MARRRIQDAEGANLDSLMDTLTNVVGILIVILVLAQIIGARQVKKLIENLLPATPEEMVSLAERRERSAASIAAAREQLAAAAAQARDAAAAAQSARLEIASLEQKLAERERTREEQERLARMVEEERRKLEKLRAEIDALMAERERLEALLGATPAPREPEARIVRIPAARPIPANARIERFFVTGGRVYHLDSAQAIRQIETELRQLKRTLERETIRNKGQDPRVIYDQEKVVAHFRNRVPRPRDAQVEIPYNRPWTRLFVLFTPRKDAGEPADALDSPASRFQNLVRTFAGNTVVYFHVSGDSFDAYLKAREIVDRRNLPAGWDMVWRAEYRETLDEFEVNRLEEPPKPPANAQPSVAPPRKTLD